MARRNTSKKAAAKKAPAKKAPKVEPAEDEVELIEAPKPVDMHRMRTSDLHRVEALKLEGWRVTEAVAPRHPVTGDRMLHKSPKYTLERPAEYKPPEDERETMERLNPDGSVTLVDAATGEPIENQEQE